MDAAVQDGKKGEKKGGSRGQSASKQGRSPQREPRQTRGRATRARVIRAASALIEKRGYDRTSMAEIAEAAGVGTTTLYHHFPDKLSIMLAIIDEWSEQLGADRRSKMHVEFLVEGGDPRAALASLLQTMHDQLQQKHWIHAELFRLMLRDESVSRHSQTLQQAGIERFAAMIELGQRRGLLRSEVDPICAGSLLCTTFEMLISRMVVTQPVRPDADLMISQLLDMFSRYLVRDS